MRRIIRCFSIDSPCLIVFLLFLAALIGCRWYASCQSLSAPAIPGWDWGAHPDTVLISYNDSCGCGPGVSDVIKQARKNNKDVLVVVARASDLPSDLTRGRLPERTYLVTDAGPALLARLSPERTTVFRIRGERILYRATGGVIPTEFFTD